MFEVRELVASLSPRTIRNDPRDANANRLIWRAILQPTIRRVTDAQFGACGTVTIGRSGQPMGVTVRCRTGSRRAAAA